MRLRKDVCIIGGGVMGLSTAYYLTKAGKSVVLLEKKEIGAGASGSCDDMILLQSKKPGINLVLALESLEIYRGLTSELGQEIGFESRGGTVLIEDENQFKVMEMFVKQQTEIGLEVRLIDKKELKHYQPLVSDRIVGSTYSSQDSQVDPLRLMRAFLAQCQSRGMEVLRGSEVVDIDRLSDHWKVRTGSGHEVECDTVVNACGAWAPQVGALTGLTVPILPLRGQLVVTEQIAPLGKANCWSALYVASKLDKSLLPEVSPYATKIGLGFSFTQAHDGNYLIGSTRENAGFNKTTSVRAIATIVEQAKSFFPVLDKVNIIRTISGFRPVSKDGNPIVGPVDGQPGMFIAAGHEGDGVALCPITGKSLANMILGGPKDDRFDQLNLRRFSITSR